MRMSRVIALVALAAIVPLTLGFGLGRQAGSAAPKLKELEGVVKAVKFAYEGCQKPEASIIMAEIGLVELGKKGKVADVPARLTKALEQIERPALRNFTRFLIAASHAEGKNAAEAADVLEALIAENAARLGAQAREKAPGGGAEGQ